MNSTTLQAQFQATSAVDKTGLVLGVSVVTAGVCAKGHDLYTDGKTLQSAY
jgi:hypothetical protein